VLFLVKTVLGEVVLILKHSRKTFKNIV